MAEARRVIAEAPERRSALDERLEDARRAIASAKERLTANQNARRAVEKDLAVVQGRLSRYKDQLMEVKTNREYHAMQHEIETAQGEVKRFEDQILEGMIEADGIQAELSAAEAALKGAEREVAAERTALDAEVTRLEAEQAEIGQARDALAREIDRAALGTFETVARGRRGQGVAQARDGLCAECHVRIRPQVYSEVRRNSSIIQCDSCQRILYYVPPAAHAAPAPAVS